MQKRALGYALIILGIITLFLNPITNITGFSVASESIDFIGNIWFFVVGVGMIIAGGMMATGSGDYYSIRAKEVTLYPRFPESRLWDLIKKENKGELSIKESKEIKELYRKLSSRGIGTDVWIARWETEGIINNLIKKGYEIEHGKNGTAIHTLGKFPFEEHFIVRKKGEKYGKHIFITPDPNDPRINQIGIKSIDNKIKIINSTIYNQRYKNEPSKQGNYADITHIDD